MEMLFRMTPVRELLGLGLGGDDVGFAWMMITTGRAHAGSIDCTVGDWGFALRRPTSTGSAELSSRACVKPPLPSVSGGCLRDGVDAAVVPMLWCGSLTPSADLPLENVVPHDPLPGTARDGLWR